MKGRKPQASRFKRAFVVAAALLGLGTGAATLNTLPKDPVTDTQSITTIHKGQWNQKGINISPSDQIWKHTLSMKSEDARANDMVAAARNGDSWRVAALLENGVSPQSRTASEALWAASYHGQLDVVNVLLDKGVDPAAYDSEALLVSVRTGQTAVAYRLLDAGAQANAQSSDALVFAAYHGDNAMVQALLDKGADPTAQDKAALKLAQDSGYDDVATTIQNAIDNWTGPAAPDDGMAGPLTGWNYRGPAIMPGGID